MHKIISIVFFTLLITSCKEGSFVDYTPDNTDLNNQNNIQDNNSDLPDDSGSGGISCPFEMFEGSLGVVRLEDIPNDGATGCKLGETTTCNGIALKCKICSSCGGISGTSLIRPFPFPIESLAL